VGYLRERPPANAARNPFQDNFMRGPLDDMDDGDDGDGSSSPPRQSGWPGRSGGWTT
jgi:hypothetical protein